MKDVDALDMLSFRISRGRAGIRRGAVSRLKQGMTNADQLKEIHLRLDDLDRKAAEAYIRNASDAMDALMDRMEGYDEARGRALLRKMEAASLISL